ncbi:putative ferric-chelate reductase 1 [Collichthys lucidus]|uniref:Putative ferric-chelate reductase 1 n=1 Tax=Collichthys lucidus TaxID=240159 RepID=A0A4U5VWJ9_COLLU|nr:putative ferric-chelate reductase 1 [Collichthys lucidus]
MSCVCYPVHGQQIGLRSSVCDAVLGFCGHIRSNHSKYHGNSKRDSNRGSNSRKQCDCNCNKCDNGTKRDGRVRKQCDCNCNKCDNGTKRDGRVRKQCDCNCNKCDNGTKRDGRVRKQRDRCTKCNNGTGHDNRVRKQCDRCTKCNNGTGHDNSGRKCNSSANRTQHHGGNSSGCGTEQLCAGEPSSCDPSTDGSCFFLAAKRQNGQNFEFALAGESDGYLAATLSTDSTLGGNDTTYVCAINNSVVQFFGALLNNGQLVVKELNVNSVKGRVTGRKIQCRFTATVPVSRARTTSFTLGISTGDFNSTSGTLGAPQTKLRSNQVNLANPNTTVTNQVTSNATTTPSPNTTPSHGVTFQQSLTQALLISAAVLSLAML